MTLPGPTKIFVNLPVASVIRSLAFFGRLGFSFNPQFTGPAAACMVVSDDIYVMLLSHEHFRQFTPGPIGDATAATQVLVCLSCSSRARVDELTAAAVAAGGTTFRAPQDHGFMYGHAFRDPDGHVWELVWMDPAAAQPVQADPLEIVIARSFAAPRAAVFRAWTNPREIEAWWGPEGFHTRVIADKARPGATWRYEMTGPDGQQHPVTGEIQELEDNRRIVSTVDFGEQLKSGAPDHPRGLVATTVFEDEGQGTRVTIRLRHRSEAERRQHEALGVVAGWHASFQRLDRHLAS